MRTSLQKRRKGADRAPGGWPVFDELLSYGYRIYNRLKPYCGESAELLDIKEATATPTTFFERAEHWKRMYEPLRSLSDDVRNSHDMVPPEEYLDEKTFLKIFGSGVHFNVLLVRKVSVAVKWYHQDTGFDISPEMIAFAGKWGSALTDWKQNFHEIRNNYEASRFAAKALVDLSEETWTRKDVRSLCLAYLATEAEWKRIVTLSAAILEREEFEQSMATKDCDVPGPGLTDDADREKTLEALKMVARLAEVNLEFFSPPKTTEWPLRRTLARRLRLFKGTCHESDRLCITSNADDWCRLEELYGIIASRLRTKTAHTQAQARQGFTIDSFCLQRQTKAASFLQRMKTFAFSHAGVNPTDRKSFSGVGPSMMTK